MITALPHYNTLQTKTNALECNVIWHQKLLWDGNTASEMLGVLLSSLLAEQLKQAVLKRVEPSNALLNDIKAFIKDLHDWNQTQNQTSHVNNTYSKHKKERGDCLEKYLSYSRRSTTCVRYERRSTKPSFHYSVFCQLKNSSDWNLCNESIFVDSRKISIPWLNIQCNEQEGVCSSKIHWMIAVRSSDLLHDENIIKKSDGLLHPCKEIQAS